MNNTPRKASPLKTLSAALLATAVVGTGVAGFSAGASLPAFAEPVRIETPAAVPGFADIVEKVSPAVVAVRVKSAVRPVSDQFSVPGFDDLPDDHPMKRFFREFGGPNFGERGQRRDGNRPRQARPVSQGSGFFISEDGYLVTNNHVIDGGEEFTVAMDDGTELDAKLVGSDPRTDLALLKVEEARKFVYVAFGDDTKTRVGDWVVAVGNPFGLGGTVTAGIVSARGRDIGAGPYDDFIQIDAAVNRGNSGGPTFNLSGEVVGINTAIFSPSGGNVGIAFAVPASVARDVIEDLKRDGAVERGWLGVQIQPVTEDIAESLGLAKAEGAIVADPQADSPAQAAGIEAGDVIVSVNGNPIKDPRTLSRTIAAFNPGTTVEIGVMRDGDQQTFDVKLGSLPAEQRAAADVPAPEKTETALSDFGITVAPAEDGKGVVITNVETGSEAEEKGLTAGDTIAEVNGVEIANARDLQNALDKAAGAGRKAALLRIESNDRSRFVALPVGRG